MFEVGDEVSVFATKTGTTYVEYELVKAEGEVLTLRSLDGSDKLVQMWFDESEINNKGLVPLYDGSVVYSVYSSHKDRDTYIVGYMISSMRAGFHLYRVRLIEKIKTYLEPNTTLSFDNFTDDELIGFVQAAEAVHLYVTKANL